MAPSSAAIRLAVERGFRTRTVGGHGSRLISEFPVAAADLAMGVVGPVLDDLRAEVERLRDLVTGPAEPASLACGCSHEGWYDPKCACCNRGAVSGAAASGGETGEVHG